MADDEDSSDSIHVVFPMTDPTPHSISPWTYDASDDDTDCNPFASSSFTQSPAASARRSSCADWFSDADSDPDRDIGSFVTDLFERRSPELKREGLGFEGFELGGEEIGGLRIVEFDSESECDDGDVSVREFFEEEAFDWEEVVEERVNDERESVGLAFENSLEVVEVVPAAETAEAEIETEFYEMALEAVQNFEWEIMMAINSLAANSSLERNSAGDGGIEDDGYVYAVGGGVEFDAVFEQFIESESALKGSPPAAKSFVESLPLVEAKVIEELVIDEVACAVCKDRISADEVVKRLPCWHYYHSDCIVPWLGIRNTCPVCRYEVPTDDPDYERRRSHGGPGQNRNSQVFFDI